MQQVNSVESQEREGLSSDRRAEISLSGNDAREKSRAEANRSIVSDRRREGRLGSDRRTEVLQRH